MKTPLYVSVCFFNRVTPWAIGITTNNAGNNVTILDMILGRMISYLTVTTILHTEMALLRKWRPNSDFSFNLWMTWITECKVQHNVYVCFLIAINLQHKNNLFVVCVYKEQDATGLSLVPWYWLSQIWTKCFCFL